MLHYNSIYIYLKRKKKSHPSLRYYGYCTLSSLIKILCHHTFPLLRQFQYTRICLIFSTNLTNLNPDQKDKKTTNRLSPWTPHTSKTSRFYDLTKPKRVESWGRVSKSLPMPFNGQPDDLSQSLAFPLGFPSNLAILKCLMSAPFASPSSTISARVLPTTGAILNP